MSKRKTLSLAVVLVIIVGVCAPPSALGNRVLYEPAPSADATQPSATSTATQPAPDAADSSDDPQQPKHKENGFAHALAAPFRALAKLFGGGRKSKSEEAKQRAPKTAPSVAASAADKSAAQVKSDANPTAASPRPAQEKKNPTASEQEATAITRGVVSGTQTSASSARPSESVRVVRPDESGVVAEKPRMWIPVIVGVPRDPLSQGRALLENGYIQEAVAELSTAAMVGPDLAEANNLLGLAYDRMGWHLQAAECYERALTASPKNAIVLANLGYSLYLADDYSGALKRLKQASKLAPGTPVIYNNIGVVEARLRHYEEAFKYFAIASNEYDAHLKLAAVFELEKRDRDAIKHYEAALRMQPGTSAILERLVALYERNGEHDKAEQARRTLGQPKNPQKTTTGGGGD